MFRTQASEILWSSWLYRERRIQHLMQLEKSMPSKRELGPNSAGQSGDQQNISDITDANDQSVEELLEESNAFEAEAVSGAEGAENPEAEVHTHEVLEDDVPEEYDNDQNRDVA